MNQGIFDFKIENETNTKIQNFDSYLIYFKSKTLNSNDNNMGVIAFLNCNKFYMKIEYVVNRMWYKEKEFNDIVSTMTVK